jgi:hypothetical protein
MCMYVCIILRMYVYMYVCVGIRSPVSRCRYGHSAGLRSFKTLRH